MNAEEVNIIFYSQVRIRVKGENGVPMTTLFHFLDLIISYFNFETMSQSKIFCWAPICHPITHNLAPPLFIASLIFFLKESFHSLNQYKIATQEGRHCQNLSNGSVLIEITI